MVRASYGFRSLLDALAVEPALDTDRHTDAEHQAGPSREGGRQAGWRDLGRLEFTVDQLSRVRAAVRRMLTGVDRQQAADVVLAVHEVAANSVVHGAGTGVLRAWDDGHQLVFEIENRRVWPSMPVTRAPTVDQLSGRGVVDGAPSR
ncbi:MAG: ATP-binding protein [Actinomycetales bacterium]